MVDAQTRRRGGARGGLPVRYVQEVAGGGLRCKRSLGWRRGGELDRGGLQCRWTSDSMEFCEEVDARLESSSQMMKTQAGEAELSGNN